MVNMPSSEWINYLAGEWDSDETSTYAGSIDSVERHLIDTMVSYCVATQSVSTPGIYDSLINEANHLLSTFNSYTWTDTTGDLAAGGLYILLASAQYHKTYGRTYQKGAIPQFIEEAAAEDAIAYAIGYFAEESDEIRAGGGNSVNPRKCNKRGLEDAGKMSLLALLIPF